MQVPKQKRAERVDSTIEPRRSNIFPSVLPPAQGFLSLLSLSSRPSTLSFQSLDSLDSPFSITTHSHPHRAPHSLNFIPMSFRDLVTIGNRPYSTSSQLPEGTGAPPQALLAQGPQDTLLQLPRPPSPLQCTLVPSSPWLATAVLTQAGSVSDLGQGSLSLPLGPLSRNLLGLRVTGALNAECR